MAELFARQEYSSWEERRRSFAMDSRQRRGVFFGMYRARFLLNRISAEPSPNSTSLRLGSDKAKRQGKRSWQHSPNGFTSVPRARVEAGEFIQGVPCEADAVQVRAAVWAGVIS